MAQQPNNPNQQDGGQPGRQRDDNQAQQNANQEPERTDHQYDPVEPERGQDNQDDNRQNENDRGQAGAMRD